MDFDQLSDADLDLANIELQTQRDALRERQLLIKRVRDARAVQADSAKILAGMSPEVQAAVAAALAARG